MPTWLDEDDDLDQNGLPYYWTAHHVLDALIGDDDIHTGYWPLAYA